MNQNETEEQKAKEREKQVRLWFRYIHDLLKELFADCKVEGNIGEHPNYGHVFVFRLRQGEQAYSCGFFLKELMKAFKTNKNPALWLSSFFVELMNTNRNHPLPSPPENDEEARRLMDGKILPLISRNIQEEYPDGNVAIGINSHPELGLVLEAGFPHITDGNNTCMLSLHYLMTLYLLNRDPSEPVIQALDVLAEQQQKV